jgi:hypothetical protein
MYFYFNIFRAPTLLNTKSVIRSILITFPNACLPLYQLDKQYKEYEGISIPYRDFGFDDLHSFLKSVDDTVILNGCGRYAIVTGVATEDNRHIESMVSKQRVSRKPHSQYGRNESTHQNRSTSFHNRTNNLNNSWIGWRERKGKNQIDIAESNKQRQGNFSQYYIYLLIRKVNPNHHSCFFKSFSDVIFFAK